MKKRNLAFALAIAVSLVACNSKSEDTATETPAATTAPEAQPTPGQQLDTGIAHSKEAAADAKQEVKDAAHAVSEGVKDGAQNAKEGAKNVAHDVKEGAKDAAKDVKNAAKEGAKKIEKAAKDGKEDLKKEGRRHSAKGLQHLAALFLYPLLQKGNNRVARCFSFPNFER